MIRNLTPTLAGVPACGLCGARFPPGANPNAVFSLSQGMMTICDKCRKPA